MEERERKKQEETRARKGFYLNAWAIASGLPRAGRFMVGQCVSMPSMAENCPRKAPRPRLLTLDEIISLE